MTNQILIPRAFDENGDVVASAQALFYEAGTTTPLTVYSDSGLNTAHNSPLVADSAGVFPQAWFDGATNIKVVVTDPDTGADLPFSPFDKAPVVALAASAASSVSFSPTVEVPATNVQEAIQHNGEQRENRAEAVKDFLDSAGMWEMRQNMGMGYFAEDATFTSNWNGSTKSGVYYSDDAAANAPAAVYLRGWVVETPAGSVSQLLVNASGTKMFLRNYTADTSTWEGWRTVASVAFASGERSITSGGALTIAHGLGEIPRNVWGRLVCKTAEHGYAVDDEVYVSTHGAVGGTDQGISIVPDATNLNVRFGSAGSPLVVMNKTTGAGSGITPANWRLKLWAQV